MRCPARDTLHRNDGILTAGRRKERETTMGIDFSHCDAHWSYRGFHLFRVKLASSIQLDLDNMEGFGSGSQSWDTISDPIKPLLDHSDCDGELSPDECRTVSPRLRELVKGWGDDYDKRHALWLADGMDLAANNNKPLEFR
jgi:hypothetical protein